MKKVMSLILVLALSLALYIPVNANGNVAVYIDGVAVQFNDSTGYPFLSGGRTLVPLRATMESFGASVDWEDSSRTAIVRKGTTTVRCVIGENCVYRNNVRIPNDAQAVETNGRTYLPIRVVLESFGAKVDWDGSVRVSSPGNAALIYAVENNPSVATNYWPIWHAAIAKKDAGDYMGAINGIMSISSIFIKDNAIDSRAILFKHLGECYSHLGQYVNAETCFRREAYYWGQGQTPEYEQIEIAANRRGNLIQTGTQVYVKTDDPSMGGRINFGVTHEPVGGTYLGAYAEADENIYHHSDPSRFYMDTFPGLVEKDMAAYLLYLPYGYSITGYWSHMNKAIEKDKILQIALEPRNGLGEVNGNDGYLVQLAQDMENSGCKMMVRFAGEMNDLSSMWYDQNPNTFIEKFRIVADIFHTYAPSVPVIWAPNFFPADTIDDYYPGDAYVDYVGMSSYAFYSSETDPLGQGVDRSRWSNQLDTIYSLYGHKKPLMVVEGGASFESNSGADTTNYASNQIFDFYTYLPIKYPNLKMCFVFDADRSSYGQKFLLSRNNQYLNAYKSAIKSDLLLSNSYDSGYKYDYYEIGNNVSVKAGFTEFTSYITTPTNDTAYVVYKINGIDVATSYGIPYTVNIDLTPYQGQRVDVTVQSFNHSHALMTTYTVGINVV